VIEQLLQLPPGTMEKTTRVRLKKAAVEERQPKTSLSKEITTLLHLEDCRMTLQCLKGN